VEQEDEDEHLVRCHPGVQQPAVASTLMTNQIGRANLIVSRMATAIALEAHVRKTARVAAPREIAMAVVTARATVQMTYIVRSDLKACMWPGLPQRKRNSV